MYSRLFRTGAIRAHPRKLALISLTGLASAFVASQTRYADVERIDPIRKLPFSTVLRSYVVYALCSVPPVVDYGPAILNFCSSVPGLKQVSREVVRATFFAQFVGGETAEQSLPLLKRFRGENKTAIFAYSVEVDETAAEETMPYKAQIEEILHSIDCAADFDSSNSGSRTWVAVKLTALLPSATSLSRLSTHLLSTRRDRSITYPGTSEESDLSILSPGDHLTSKDISDIRELHANLERICERARQRGVKIVLDAKYSWYQPAIDAYTLSLSRTFNVPSKTSQVQPLVYATYQAYLRRNFDHLQSCLQDAKRHGYALGVKLVRGAYHAQEQAAAPGVVWDHKSETDECYAKSVSLLLSSIQNDIPKEKGTSPSLPSVGVLFGTHNWDSCRQILRELVDRGMADAIGADVISISQPVAERLQVAQLYGMCDALTDYLVEHIRSPLPVVSKYVPYGTIAEVMPYLARRAVENKSVLGGRGGAADERSRMGQEIWRRFRSLSSFT